MHAAKAHGESQSSPVRPQIQRHSMIVSSRISAIPNARAQYAGFAALAPLSLYMHLSRICAWLSNCNTCMKMTGHAARSLVWFVLHLDDNDSAICACSFFSFLLCFHILKAIPNIKPMTEQATETAIPTISPVPRPPDPEPLALLL